MAGKVHNHTKDSLVERVSRKIEITQDKKEFGHSIMQKESPRGQIKRAIDLARKKVR